MGVCLSSVVPSPIRNHFLHIQELMENVPAGDLAEFGVFEGGTTVQLASFGRKVWAFDTFSGIPEEDFRKYIDWQNPPGKFSADPRKELSRLGNIECIAGRFAESLPRFDPAVRFAFAYVDCDLYESYRQVLAFLDKRMLPGGIFLCDDQSCEGALKAMKEFLEIYSWKTDCNFEVFRRKAS